MGFGSSAAAGAGADMLQQILRQKFEEAFANQQLQRQIAAQQAQEQHYRTIEQQNAGENDLRRRLLESQINAPPPAPKPIVVGGRIIDPTTFKPLYEPPPETPAAKPPVPVLRISRGGKLENLGDAPAGAHFVNEPEPKTSSNQGSLSPEGLALAANYLANGGGMLPLGMGAAGIRTQIINEAAKRTDPTSLAGNVAGFQANKGSLAKLQQSRDTIRSFEQTAQKNIGILEGTMKRLTDVGSPLLNRPIREWEQRAQGDPNMAGFAAARRVVVNEVAKITTNPNLAGMLSDEARKEADLMLSGDMTLPQMMTALNVLKQDMQNRIGSFDQQIGEVQGRFGAKTAPATPAAKPTAADLIKKYGGQ